MYRYAWLVLSGYSGANCLLFLLCARIFTRCSISMTIILCTGTLYYRKQYAYDSSKRSR